ncbi:MAG: hypothetical protein WD080_04640 [Egibacteraceae bacterium]
MRRPPRRVALDVVLVGVTAATGVAVARRALARIEPPTNITGAPVPLDRPFRPRLGSAPDARILPPRWEPLGLSALARWEPAPPRRAVARAAAYAWAAPLTAVGLLVGGLAGVRPRVREGVLLFADARGPAGAVLRSRGFSAGAIGHVVVALNDPSPRLFAHELAHVRQAERLGLGLAPLYLGLLAVYGYARHPLERAARVAARRTAGAP